MADWVGRIVAPAVVYVSSLKEAFSPAVLFYICCLLFGFLMYCHLSIVIYCIQYEKLEDGASKHIKTRYYMVHQQ